MTGKVQEKAAEVSAKVEEKLRDAAAGVQSAADKVARGKEARARPAARTALLLTHTRGSRSARGCGTLLAGHGTCSLTVVLTLPPSSAARQGGGLKELARS